jgi:HD-GYP domain-containing protein (c-di-GMP phosphodiesterase class II)
MAIKKINIKQLEIGMFITGLDISWIRSPFLKHSRLIGHNNDIQLLIQAGVQEVTIDTAKSVDTKADNSLEKQKINKPQQKPLSSETAPEAEISLVFNQTASATTLTEELNNAIILKDKAYKTFSNLTDTIKTNKTLPINEVSPIIDDSINSLLKNNQALLTLMHMRRNEKDLFLHSFSTMSLLLSLAISLGYSEEQLKLFGTAALLHDLGWSKIPLHILAKNKKYTANETKIMQQHIMLIVNPLTSEKENDSELIKLILEHHERGDGSGYPNGLKSADLSEESSLLALVDYYDELIHGLLDRPGVIPSLALKILYNESLKGKFYKKHVEQLIVLLGIYPLTSAIQLLSGEKAIVCEINRDNPLKPKIRIIYDKNGIAVSHPYEIDLNNDEECREICQVVDISDLKQDPLKLLVVRNPR